MSKTLDDLADIEVGIIASASPTYHGAVSASHQLMSSGIFREAAKLFVDISPEELQDFVRRRGKDARHLVACAVQIPELEGVVLDGLPVLGYDMRELAFLSYRASADGSLRILDYIEGEMEFHALDIVPFCHGDCAPVVSRATDIFSDRIEGYMDAIESKGETADEMSKALRHSFPELWLYARPTTLRRYVEFRKLSSAWVPPEVVNSPFFENAKLSSELVWAYHEGRLRKRVEDSDREFIEWLSTLKHIEKRDVNHYEWMVDFFASKLKIYGEIQTVPPKVSEAIGELTGEVAEAVGTQAVVKATLPILPIRGDDDDLNRSQLLTFLRELFGKSRNSAIYASNNLRAVRSLLNGDTEISTTTYPNGRLCLDAGNERYPDLIVMAMDLLSLSAVDSVLVSGNVQNPVYPLLNHRKGFAKGQYAQDFSLWILRKAIERGLTINCAPCGADHNHFRLCYYGIRNATRDIAERMNIGHFEDTRKPLPSYGVLYTLSKKTSIADLRRRLGGDGFLTWINGRPGLVHNGDLHPNLDIFGSMGALSEELVAVGTDPFLYARATKEITMYRLHFTSGEVQMHFEYNHYGSPKPWDVNEAFLAKAYSPTQPVTPSLPSCE